MAEALSANAKAILATFLDKREDQLTAKDLAHFEKEFPGMLEKITNKDAEVARLYDVPHGLRTIWNRGGGDCLYLALIQLLTPTAQATDQDLVLTSRQFRAVAADGLPVVLRDSGNSWSTFKTLLNDNDQKTIADIEADMKQVLEPAQLRAMTPHEKDELEMDWFTERMREDNKIWGDNMYLLMFLRSPNNPYLRHMNLNILLLDRLAPGVLKGVRQRWAAPICFSSATRESHHEKCMWGILIRTRTDDGKGAMHYEAAVFPDMAKTGTRFAGMYGSRELTNGLVQADYLEQVMALTECSEFFRQCLAAYEKRRRDAE